MLYIDPLEERIENEMRNEKESVILPASPTNLTMSGLLNSIKEATGYTPTTSDEEENVGQLEEQDTCGGICPELTYQQVRKEI